MKHQTDPLSGGKVLKKIASEFLRFHKEGGKHHSERLKSMAISAVSTGASRSSVAKAAGVSTNTISNWAAKVPKAKQLKVIATAETARLRQATPMAETVSIRLASGVEIDLPRSEMSLEFLVALNSLGGSR